MRLKEDKSNWKASNILRKIAPLPEEPVFKKKKNTTKWCRGKKGAEHAYKLLEKTDWLGFHFETHKCENCGKKKYK